MQIAVVIIIVIAFIIAMMVITGVMLSAPRYKGPMSDHFDGSRFVNPGGLKPKGVVQLFKWMINRKRGPWQEDHREAYGLHPLGHFKDGIRVTFVNHSTFLIQADGYNILTDPVWSRRVSPYRWIGPKRMRPPGIRIGDLPRIHLVLITHNHYDHLDIETLRTVFGAHHPRIMTPLGVKAYLDDEYISGADELDWWDELSLDDVLKVQAVPAQHFSGRGLIDRDATLWCGYVIRTTAGNIYFSGDTGYNENSFREIGSRSGPFKLSMIPIGAYKPGWFMAPVHVSPEEAVRIHRDVRSETSIAMHFGTFPLADDGRDEPVNDLERATEKFGLGSDNFIVLKEGEFKVFE